MEQKLNVLILEDNEFDLEIVQRELLKSSNQIIFFHAEDENSFLKILGEQEIDIILCDNSLPQFSASHALTTVRGKNLDIPFIIVTGSMSEEFAVECIKAGADDYIIKDRITRLNSAIDGAIQRRQKEVQRIEALDKLVKSENAYRTLVDRVSDAFISLDSSLNLTFINDLAAEMFGTPGSLLIGQNIYDLFPIPNNELLNNAFQQALLTKENVNLEVFTILFQKWIRFNFYPSDTGCTILFSDISKIKETEKNLEKSKRIIQFISEVNETILRAKTTEEIFEKICQISIETGKFACALISDYTNKANAPVLFKWANAANKNVATFDNHNYTKEQLKDIKMMREMFTKIKYFCSNDIESDPIMVNWKAELLNNGCRSVIALPIVIEKKLFAIINLYSAETNFFNEEEINLLQQVTNNISFGINAILVNIRKQELEIQQNVMSMDLVRRNSDLENFSYILSHNIRSPLSNILGINSILLKEKTEGNVRKFIEYNAQAAFNLDAVVKDVSKILHLEKVFFEEREHIQLQLLINEIIEEYKDWIDENSAIINCDFTNIAALYSVKSQIKNIFTELILNAFKFSKNGAPPFIEIKTELEGETIKIYLKDYGIGIDVKRYRDSLFGLYKKLSFKKEGKGMGLFLVKTQVNNLNGQIEVFSEINQWTEFVISLPLALQPNA